MSLLNPFVEDWFDLIKEGFDSLVVNPEEEPVGSAGWSKNIGASCKVTRSQLLILEKRIDSSDGELGGKAEGGGQRGWLDRLPRRIRRDDFLDYVYNSKGYR